MVKGKNIKVTVAKRVATPKPKKMKRVRRPKQRNAPLDAGGFGPVATIDTAPTSIGNTICGATPIIIPMDDGVRVKGRDFLFTCNPTSTSFLNWQLVGGAPITPACMVSSALKNYSTMYAQYQVHAVAFHYVTAVPTSDAGSVMMYVAKNRGDPGVNPSSVNLLPFVLSDEHTVISPVWKNASSVYYPAPNWYSTAFDNDEGLHEQAPGEIFLFSKIGPADAPGYVLIDYDISFRVHQVNIKNTVYPAVRMKYTEVVLRAPSFASTVDVSVVTADFVGTLLDGVTASSPPTGYAIGDIYKVVLTVNGATFGAGVINSTVLDVPLGNSNFLDFIPTDGMTFFITAVTSTAYLIYPNYTAAQTGTNPMVAGVSSGTYAWAYHAFVSLCGAESGVMLQSNI